MHVHIDSSQGEAKFWIEPVVALAEYHGLTNKQLKELQKVVESRRNEITKVWNKHFKSRSS